MPHYFVLVLIDEANPLRPKAHKEPISPVMEIVFRFSDTRLNLKTAKIKHANLFGPQDFGGKYHDTWKVGGEFDGLLGQFDPQPNRWAEYQQGLYIGNTCPVANLPENFVPSIISAPKFKWYEEVDHKPGAPLLRNKDYHNPKDPDWAMTSAKILGEHAGCIGVAIDLHKKILTAEEKILAKEKSFEYRPYTVSDREDSDIENDDDDFDDDE